MFQKQTYFAFLLSIIFLCGSLVYFSLTTSEDYEEYRALLLTSKGTKGSPIAIDKGQTRNHATKRLLYLKPSGERTQLFLYSPKSFLALAVNGEQREVVEELDNVVCLIPKDIASQEVGKQVVEKLEARKAVYSYKTGILTGQDVKLARLVVPKGFLDLHTEPLEKLMEGKASHIECSLSNSGMPLKAKDLKASFSGSM